MIPSNPQIADLPVRTEFLDPKALQGSRISWGWLKWLQSIDVSATASPQFVDVPSSSTAAGVPGQFAISDSGDFFYVCVASNSWKRFALSSW